MSTLAVLQSLKESVLSQASVKAIYGEPISAHGKTVVPVAKIMYGYGAGAGTGGVGDASARGSPRPRRECDLRSTVAGIGVGPGEYGDRRIVLGNPDRWDDKARLDRAAGLRHARLDDPWTAVPLDGGSGALPG